jgi:hypothetical protein
MRGEPTDALEGDGIRAADALRHDLGKAIRFSAPEVIESSDETLRERLRDDVLRTRRGASSTHSAAEVFVEWRRHEEGRLPAGRPLEIVRTLSSLIEEIRRLAGDLDHLDRPGLVRLDGLTLRVADECRGLVASVREVERDGR